MSDDEADPELVELLRQHMQGKLTVQEKEPELGVLDGCEHVYDNCIDVALDMLASKRAAETIYTKMQEQEFSTSSWSQHELHPKARDESTVAFIFTMDLLNFCFWSDLPDDEAFAVEYRGKQWKGYWSLVASLQRALDEDIPVTDPEYWRDGERCNLDSMKHIFRSSTEEEMPMLKERLDCLQEASQVLYEYYDSSAVNLVEAADGSAARLVNILARDFSCFRDEHTYEGYSKPVRFLKRAQIFVADLWACFEGESYGDFYDIDKITMFADYRIPQILITLGALYCSPTVAAAINDKQRLESGSRWEIQLRACSIWGVELIRREIKRQHPESHINAILIDFFLYDTMKEMEKEGKESIPHHRTRSIWY